MQTDNPSSAIELTDDRSPNSNILCSNYMTFTWKTILNLETSSSEKKREREESCEQNDVKVGDTNEQIKAIFMLTFKRNFVLIDVDCVVWGIISKSHLIKINGFRLWDEIIYYYNKRGPSDSLSLYFDRETSSDERRHLMLLYCYGRCGGRDWWCTPAASVTHAHIVLESYFFGQNIIEHRLEWAGRAITRLWLMSDPVKIKASSRLYFIFCVYHVWWNPRYLVHFSPITNLLLTTQTTVKLKWSSIDRIITRNGLFHLHSSNKSCNDQNFLLGVKIRARAPSNLT